MRFQSLSLLRIDIDVVCEFKIPNIVVDVVFKLFKLLIDNVELVDNEFRLENIVVDVVFKLLIDNVELVDKLFKFVFDA